MSPSVADPSLLDDALMVEEAANFVDWFDSDKSSNFVGDVRGYRLRQVAERLRALGELKVAPSPLLAALPASPTAPPAPSYASTIEACASVADRIADAFENNMSAAKRVGSSAGAGDAIGARSAAKEIAYQIRKMYVAPPSLPASAEQPT